MSILDDILSRAITCNQLLEDARSHGLTVAKQEEELKLRKLLKAALELI